LQKIDHGGRQARIKRKHIHDFIAHNDAQSLSAIAAPKSREFHL
jgi:hypothetical protein